jgi:solute carrier family 12 (sodium/potassium/chloride transporter), member 2
MRDITFDMQENNSTGFGTFSGVFTPTIVTILGVILYLRQGWLVGSGGLLGAWLIIVLCVTITMTTALSLSSIATNTRLHAGGAYAIISRSLGKETGASIGLLLYIAQSMAIAMYLFGFRDGWLFMFPNHNPFYIDIMCFISIFAIAKLSTKMAFRLQYLVITITGLCILSVSWAPFESSQSIEWIGSFQGNGYQGFWNSFAIFFPGVTGILAGSNLSGELRNPRHSIPRGTLMAVIVSTSIYLWLAYVYAASVPSAELLENYNVMSKISLFPSLIPIAIVCATFCSALATLVGAPRILNALAKDGLIPLSGVLKKTDHRNEPSNAIVFTGILLLIFICLRSLDVIAPLITICFLTTYGVINLVVLIEQKLGLLSFRPTLSIPSWIPLIGATSCFLAMMIINPTVSLLALLSIILGYISLGRKLEEEREDVRTNLFLAIARWAARKSFKGSSQEGKAWMPHPIVPLIKNEEKSNLNLAITLAHPKGGIHVLALNENIITEAISKLLDKYEVFSRVTVVKQNKPQEGLLFAMEMLKNDFFHPNIVIVSDKDRNYFPDFPLILNRAIEEQLGIIYHSSRSLPKHGEHFVNVWVRPQSESWNLNIAQREGNLDLALLLAIRISKSQGLTIRLVTTLQNKEEMYPAEKYLEGLVDLGRLPTSTIAAAFLGSIWDCLHQAPSAKVHIFGLPTENSTNFIERVEEQTHGQCIFVQGSGKENLLA